MIEKTYFETEEALYNLSGYSGFLQQRLEACVEAADDGYYFFKRFNIIEYA